MRRFLLAGCVAMVVATAANAQTFIRPAPFGFQPYYSRYNFGYAYFPSATGGYGFTFSRGYAFQTTLLANTYYPTLDPKAVPNYYYGSVGMAGGVDAIGVRQQNALRMAQLQARNDAFLRQQAMDKFNVAANPERLKAAPDAVRKALTEPTQDQITSGAALNQLLTEIHKAKSVAGSGADVLSPDLLAGLTFAGAPAAEVIDLARAGRVTYPFGLTSSDYDSLRTSLDRTITAVAADLNAGRRVDAALAEQMTNDVKRMRNKVNALARENRTEAQAKVFLTFLDHLSATAADLKKTGGEGVVVSDWQSSGATVAELADYLKRHGLTFGPAGDGQDAAYLAVHRGFAGYLGELWK